MRPIERINNFLKLVDLYKLADRWKIDFDLFRKMLNGNRYFELYWQSNPDQRFGQVLINLSLIPDSFQAWNDEEDDILAAQGIPPEQYLYWTSIFNKDGQKLLEPVTRLISDLETDHINNILVDPRLKLSPLYIQVFNNILQYRQVKEDESKLL